MKILFHTIALNRCDLLKQTIDSIDTKHDWDLLLHFVSRDPEIAEYLASGKIATGARTEFICDIGYNIGVSYCFNEALRQGYDDGDYDYVFLVNSDIRFHPGDSDGMISLAEKSQDKALVTVKGTHGKHGEGWENSHGIAAGILMPGTFMDVGYFDENIFPAYYEDCDYFYRVLLTRGTGAPGESSSQERVDNPLVACLLTGRTHHEGSSVISSNNRMLKLNSYFYDRNKKYYICKWGGANNKEKYRIPFSETDSLKIEKNREQILWKGIRQITREKALFRLCQEQNLYATGDTENVQFHESIEVNCCYFTSGSLFPCIHPLSVLPSASRRRVLPV